MLIRAKKGAARATPFRPCGAYELQLEVHAHADDDFVLLVLLRVGVAIDVGRINAATTGKAVGRAQRSHGLVVARNAAQIGTDIVQHSQADFANTDAAAKRNIGLVFQLSEANRIWEFCG